MMMTESKRVTVEEYARRYGMTVEDYARRYGKLHYNVSIAMKPFFSGDTEMSMAEVRVKVKPHGWIGFRAVGRMTGDTKGARPRAFVLNKTIYCPEGWLNGAWTRRKRPDGTVEVDAWAADLSEIGGWGKLGHEIWHVWQVKRHGLVGMAWRALKGVWPSLRHSGTLYDHQEMEHEQEAIRFAMFVAETIKAERSKIWLEHWKDLR
jgi:hypothetical protein